MTAIQAPFKENEEYVYNNRICESKKFTPNFTPNLNKIRTTDKRKQVSKTDTTKRSSESYSVHQVSHDKFPS